MVDKKSQKLTKVQAEVLGLLDAGAVMAIDSTNLAKIGDRDIASKTRYFLTDNRLVTRKDKNKAVTTTGNGYVITEKGKKLLSEYQGGQK
ncbi:hypothetical protein A6779_18825 [Marinobacter adhaerens]|uniref:Uncharacterized protein n=1 Tax=Marinobacter salsuginis TaxID=418719 RepID=A0A5M3PQL4_9GAMM|nr:MULTISPECIES: hypothetical protein [Marinobacter]ODM31207.1 hypothetical protein A6779_18825 [Marinobacter adhaerens]GBO85039.1 hypothetical protein MS5N3_24900 [Marinobacter salsuginis]